jgi:hypothetical protein
VLIRERAVPSAVSRGACITADLCDLYAPNAPTERHVESSISERRWARTARV